jgi:uncharacterized SAM-binding protein YcdF (DUF218 family)
MRRAVASFRKVGLDPIPLPIPDAYKRYSSLADRWSVFLDLAMETGKLVRYKLLGYI